MASGGIQIDLISREKLSEMTPEQRIRFIVDEIKAGKVLVLERGLTAKEELELIRVTMAEIDHESFIGVEMPGFSIDLKKQGFLNKLMGRKPPPRMMVVGPAHMLKTIKKDGEMVQAMIVTKESMGQITMDQLPPPPDDWVPPVPKTPEGEMPAEPEEEGGDASPDTPTGEPTETTETSSDQEPTEGEEGERDDVPVEEAPPEQKEDVPSEEPKEGDEPTQEEPKEEGKGASDTPQDDEQVAEENKTGEPEGQGTPDKNKSKKYHSLTNYPEEPTAEGEGEEKKEADQKPEGEA